LNRTNPLIHREFRTIFPLKDFPIQAKGERNELAAVPESQLGNGDGV